MDGFAEWMNLIFTWLLRLLWALALIAAFSLGWWLKTLPVWCK